MVKRVGNRPDNRSQGRVQEVDLPRSTDPVERALQVQPTHDSGFVVREQLGTLISSRRRPPALKVVKTVAPNESVSGEISPEGLALLADVRGDVLAYHIAELSMRLNQLDKEGLEPEDLRAIHSVNQLTRMFEHLHILRTTQVAR